MATKKERPSSTFFSFNKIGDSVSGILDGFFIGQYGLNAVISGIGVSLNKTQLMNIIGNYRDSFKTGKKIKITLVDEKKVKGQKHQVKIFSVLYDGKELKAENSFELHKSLEDKKFDILFEK